MGFSGHRMKARREALNIKVRELAALVGIGEGEIRRYEAGKHRPGDAKIVAIARGLRTSSDYLLEISDEPGALGAPEPSGQAPALDTLPGGQRKPRKPGAR